MNNLSHKVAVVSVCTVLGFTLGANEQAKAATITLASTGTYAVLDYNNGVYKFDGMGDIVYRPFNFTVARGSDSERALLAEFNIGSFFQIPNITSAIFQAEIETLDLMSGTVNNEVTNPGSLALFGYEGNGTAEPSDLEAGVLLSSVNISSSSPGDILNFDVTQFVKQGVSNNNAFAGFTIRALNLGGLSLGSIQPRLVVETAEIVKPEPVPEPTTIFGSAIALGVAGWLKRKKSAA